MGSGGFRSGEVRLSLPDDVPRVRALAGASPFPALRYLALFGYPDAAIQEQRDRVQMLLSRDDGVHLVIDGEDAATAQVSIVPVDDLSDHFGMPFHDVGPVLNAPGPSAERLARARLILSAAIDSIADGVLVLRVEGDDRATLLAAEAVGFRVMETTLTFVNDLARSDRNLDTDAADVTLHRLGVDPPLPHDVFDQVRVGAGQLTEDHYHADPRLADWLCDDLYRRLFDRGLQGVGSDALVLRWHQGIVIGLGLWRHWDHLEPYGVSIAGSGFGFRAQQLPSGTGSGLTAFVCNNQVTGNRLLEWSTQATNLPMVNMINTQRSIRLCRTSYVLHRWSDGRWT